MDKSVPLFTIEIQQKRIMANSNNPNTPIDSLKTLTWNIRGLNDHRKLRKVFGYLNRHNIDLALLQETHLPIGSQILRRKNLLNYSHASGFTTRARGVLTWVNPKTNYTLSLLETDTDGRYVISRVKARGLDLIVVNSYGPNFDCPAFFHNIAAKLRHYNTEHVLWGGDFNLVRDPVLDRSGGPHRPISKAAVALDSIMISRGLADIWRFKNPVEGGYTHYSAYHDLHTRIDYWLTSSTLLQQVTECNTLPRTLSDHSPLLLKLTTPRKTLPPFTWRFPPYALLDPTFKQELAEAIDIYFDKNIASVDSFQTIWEAFKVYIRGISDNRKLIERPGATSINRKYTRNHCLYKVTPNRVSR